MILNGPATARVGVLRLNYVIVQQGFNRNYAEKAEFFDRSVDGPCIGYVVYEFMRTGSLTGSPIFIPVVRRICGVRVYIQLT